MSELLCGHALTLEYERLKKENAELREENEQLKKSFRPRTSVEVITGQPLECLNWAPKEIVKKVDKYL
jgi:hypothetical protein